MDQMNHQNQQHLRNSHYDNIPLHTSNESAVIDPAASSPVDSPNLLHNDNTNNNNDNNNNSPTQLKKTLSLANAVGLVIGTMVGSGIFASPGIILKYTSYPGLALLLWVICGILSMFGALTYSELALTLPNSGGELEYLKRGFGQTSCNLGSLFSFLFIWTSSFVTRPASVAIISLVFGEYLYQAFHYLSHPVEKDNGNNGLLGSINNSLNATNDSVVENNMAASKTLAVICIVMVTILNSWSVSGSAKAQDILSSIKTFTLFLICISAVIFVGIMHKGYPGNLSWNSLISPVKSSNSTKASYRSGNQKDIPNLSLTGILIAFQSGLFTFDGWNSLSYATEELENPEILLLATRIAVPLVIGLYLFVNMAYFSVLDLVHVATTDVVGFDFAVEMMGDSGAVLMSLCVALSAFGAAHGTLYGASRVVFAAGRDHVLPAYFGVVHPMTMTPIRAILFQGLLSVLILLPGDFENLIDYFSCGAWTFYLLTAVALIRLRYIEPDLERPYKSHLLLPILFLIASFLLIVTSIAMTPASSLIAFGFMALGIPFWYIFLIRQVNLRDFCIKKDHQVVATNDIDEEVHT